MTEAITLTYERMETMTNNKSQIISVRFSEEEAALVAYNAKQLRMSVSVFIRTCALQRIYLAGEKPESDEIPALLIHQDELVEMSNSLREHTFKLNNLLKQIGRLSKPSDNIGEIMEVLAKYCEQKNETVSLLSNLADITEGISTFMSNRKIQAMMVAQKDCHASCSIDEIGE